MSQRTKNIIGGVILLVIIFAAYSFFFGKKENGALLVSQEVTASKESGIVREFLVLLNTLSSIKLDSGLFQDPLFNSLRDESVELLDQPRGRRNPFAPLE